MVVVYPWCKTSLYILGVIRLVSAFIHGPITINWKYEICINQNRLMCAFEIKLK